ncbi:hypothetical protein GTY75_31190 [Streptomyces sp. SID8381]|nr:hypothetical protein [Streptomyces sp. SID8381]
MDRRLHFPEHIWYPDPDRRSGAGVSAKVVFATKPRLAWQMIEAALGAGCPSNWVTGDEVRGQDPRLRSALEARGIGCVLAVACTTKVRIDENRTVFPAATVAASLPPDTWHR